MPQRDGDNQRSNQMTINDMAETLREALEDERRELGTLRTQIAYIQERMDRMIDVAKGIEEEAKEQQDG
jgi:hypothetical protein